MDNPHRTVCVHVARILIKKKKKLIFFIARAVKKIIKMFLNKSIITIVKLENDHN